MSAPAARPGTAAGSAIERAGRGSRGEHDLAAQPSALQSAVGLVEALEWQRLGDAHCQLARRGATREVGRRCGIRLHLHSSGINPTLRIGHRGRD
jgi:hypothetical protein